MIGIGGTGAKVVEALAHVLAAGVTEETVNILLVDPDVANGSLERCTQTLQVYRDARELTQMGEVGFLKAPVETTNPKVWSPFTDDAQPTFQRLFNYDSMGTVAAGLLDVLYTQSEKTADLRKGFLGRPSIGATVMAEALDLEQDEPWKTWCGRMRNDRQAKIFIVGSVFGGTGAAGLPTFARLLADFLRDRAGMYRLGCALMLPYFSFPPNADPAQLQAKADEFILRSQAALNYYYQKLRQETGETYQAVYLLGSEDQPPVGKNSLGAREQRNPPHYLELYAALAMMDFFNQPINADPHTHTIACENASQLTWASLPAVNQFEAKFANLARFAYAYWGYFYPRLKAQIAGSRELDRVTWYINFFTKEDLIGKRTAETEAVLDRVADYCKFFLLWLADLHQFTGDFRLGLFDTKAYTVTANREVSIPNDEYRRLYPVRNDKLPATFAKIGEVLNTRRAMESINVRGAARFLYALYQETRTI